jgi:hypothetical protein
MKYDIHFIYKEYRVTTIEADNEDDAEMTLKHMDGDELSKLGSVIAIEDPDIQTLIKA